MHDFYFYNIKLKQKMQPNPVQNRYMSMAANQQLVGVRPHMQARMPMAMPTQALIQHQHKNAKMHNLLQQKGVSQSLVEGEKKDGKTILGYAAAFGLGFLASSHPKAKDFNFMPQVNVGVQL